MKIYNYMSKITSKIKWEEKTLFWVMEVNIIIWQKAFMSTMLYLRSIWITLISDDTSFITGTSIDVAGGIFEGTQFYNCNSQ